MSSPQSAKLARKGRKEDAKCAKVFRTSSMLCVLCVFFVAFAALKDELTRAAEKAVRFKQMLEAREKSEFTSESPDHAAEPYYLSNRFTHLRNTLLPY